MRNQTKEKMLTWVTKIMLNHNHINKIGFQCNLKFIEWVGS